MEVLKPREQVSMATKKETDKKREGRRGKEQNVEEKRAVLEKGPQGFTVSLNRKTKKLKG